jgi:hypothetical protein
MSAGATGIRSHTLAWIGAPFLALAFYVGAYPIVIIKSTTLTSRPLIPGPRHSSISPVILEANTASWASTLYRPLHRLCAYSGVSQEALAHYWTWCDATLGLHGAAVGMTLPPLSLRFPDR